MHTKVTLVEGRQAGFSLHAATFYELQNGDGQPAIRNGFIGFE